MIDSNWLNTTKEQDPEFIGSIWEEMGWDNALCPTCNAHLWKGICLNACHLTPGGRRRFSKAIQRVSEANNDPR